MEQRITHACGHEQPQRLTGYASQQDRKARWSQTTKCRACFITERKSEQAEAATLADAAVAHLAQATCRQRAASSLGDNDPSRPPGHNHFWVCNKWR